MVIFLYRKLITVDTTQTDDANLSKLRIPRDAVVRPGLHTS